MIIGLFLKDNQFFLNTSQDVKFVTDPNAINTCNLILVEAENLKTLPPASQSLILVNSLTPLYAPYPYLRFINWKYYQSLKVWELATDISLSDFQKNILNTFFQYLQKEYILVPEQIGTPSLRVLAMIINEAYWVLQQQLAEKESIEKALRYGTNYPYGPIEWSEKIGIRNIFDLLVALQKEYGNETYKIAPLLKKKALSL